MLDRALKLIITLTLLLFLLQSVIGVLTRVLETAPRGAVSILGSAGGFLVQLLVAAAVLSFAIGLLVRFVHWVRGKDPRRLSGRGQSSNESASRVFADEVPVDRPGRRQSRSCSRRRS